jgi:hypothetical protein
MIINFECTVITIIKFYSTGHWVEFSTLDVGMLVHAIQLPSIQMQPSLELKTWPKQLLRSLLLAFTLPGQTSADRTKPGPSFQL